MSTLDFSFLSWDYVQNYILGGLWFTFKVTLIATVFGTLLGTLFALMRLSSIKVFNWISVIYVDTLRAVPLVMVILWFYLLIPLLIGHAIGKEQSIIITFTLFEAAYFAEIMRAGIQSVQRGQIYAGYAMGMSYRQTMQLVVLPQAFRNMLPVLMTQIIVMLQDTSLAYAIGAYDLLKGFQLAGQNMGRPVEGNLLAAAVYFVICYGLSSGVRRLQKKVAIIR
jgi:glutamate/aspartate transport system permease protein